MTEFSFSKWLSHPPQGEEVVISGISGRLPESNNIYEFRDNLFNKKDMVTSDGRRWLVDNPEIPQKNAKIFNIEKFDCGYFGIHKRQADNMEPMMRQFLEVAVESIMDAGVNPSELEGTNTGVFVGACFADMESEAFMTATEPQQMTLTGYLRFFIPNRISYHLKLKGPSYVVDTACSSSLNALEHAFKAIRSGQCNSALVGGTNLLLHPGVTLQFYRLGVLSSDGACKVFDQNANGYVKGEAIACIYLQKAKDAKRIYGKIIHTKLNCDGFKPLGITFPSTQMQQQLMTEVFDDADLTPSHLSFLEAHGTGTEVGDPEEVEAIDNALAKRRKEPLLIGSVKSSIGHTEPASGLCSLIKVIIAMETGYIPPNINLTKIKTGLEGFEQGRLKVVTETTNLEGEDAVIAINNFGFGGNNCHLIVQRFNKKQIDGGLPNDDIPRLICVSGRTEESISTFLDNLNHKSIDKEYVGLLHQLFMKNMANYHYRGYTIIARTGPIKTSFKLCVKQTRPLYIFFGLFDKSYKIVSKHLLNFPIFKNSLLRINRHLLRKNINIIDIISQNNENNALGTIAVQIGIVDVLKKIGLSPTAVYGASLGRIACGYYYNTITLKEAILVGYKCAVSKETSSTNLENILCDLETKSMKDQGSHSDFLNQLDYNKCTLVNISDTVINHHELLFVEEGSVKFLEILGSLYEEGHILALSHLYPKIEFPVSRGTSMVSPLINWYHKKDCFTRKFCGFDSLNVQQGEFNFAPQYSDDKFFAGHVIDGRSLFPATGYLLLVWETYAVSRRLMVNDIPIVLENCKFIKAVALPKNNYLNLMVTIQKKSGNFEVVHQNSVVVTGRIFTLEDPSSCQTNLDTNVFNEEDPKFILEQDEIYRELYLRGYNYSGLFKGLVKCNDEVTKGLVKWNNNWVTFMDNMLQMTILQLDSRSLYVPTGIKKLVIEPRKFLSLVKDTEDCLIPVSVYRDCNILKTYGIEISGIQATSISRRKHTAVPVLEKYEFVPNCSLLDLAESVRINIQLILENSLEYNFKATEIVEDSTDYKFLMPLVAQVLEDLPLVNPNLIISTKATLEEIPGVKIEDFTLTPESNLLLIIGTKILQKSNLTPILKALNQNGFVLTREDIGYVPQQIKNVEIVTQHVTKDSTLILFRKSEEYTNAKFIKVSSNQFDWIPELQDSLKHEANTYIWSQNQELEGIMGLVNCIRREPGGKKVKCFFIIDEAPEFNSQHPFYLHQIKKQLAVNIYKNCKWGTYRHLPLEDVKEVESEHCYVNTTAKSDLSSLKWIEGPLTSKTPLNEDYTLVYGYYCSVNFKDIMVASGRITADVITLDRIEQENLLGFEFTGIDLRGRRIMGFSRNAALSTMIVSKKKLHWIIPDTWSLEDAVTVPVVYGTVLYALLWETTLKPRSSILIHSAAGGIGIAALNICLFHGCNIFVTVGTQEKRDYLKENFPEIPESHIGNSHDTSFEEMIKYETNGRGVDIVLNSLADEKLKASVRCLARGGKFLEIGKFDIANDTALSLLLLEKECSYHGIMVDRILGKYEDIEMWLVKKLYEGISLGYVKPLRRTVFKQDEVEKAFRYMTTGKHIGKVVINIRDKKEIVGSSNVIFKGISRFFCNSEKTYIIVGGLGGFGMELADWLMLRYAKKIILVSTSGVKTGYQTQRIRIWESYGVVIKISKTDVTTKEGCRSLIDEANKLGPIDGIFNLAVMLKDALFEDQTEEKFRTSLAPKAQATLYLDQVTRELCPNLRLFVVFSSVSCGRGNVGQTNYGMANSIMERICEKRKRDGFAALAIQWGAIGEVGLVAKMQKENKELVIGGTLQQKVSSCLEALDKFLKQEHPVVASMVVAEKHNRGFDAGSAVDAVAYILGIKDLKTVNKEATLIELGMDSITGTEIIQLLEKDFEIYITAKEIRSLTFAKLMELETDKKKNDDQGSTKNLKGIDLILQYFPEIKSVSDSPIFEMPSNIKSEEKASIVFALAGVEGTFVPLEPLISNLNAHVFGVHYNYHNPEDSIEESATTILPFIREKIGKNQSIYIFAYSFGSVVAIEIASVLESEGYICNIIAIDGSPAYLTNAAKEFLKTGTEAEFQTEVLFKLLSLVLSTDFLLENKEKFLKCEDFEGRINFGMSLIPPNISKENVDRQWAIAVYKRLKSIINYNFSRNKIKSSVNLFRALIPLINNMENDYKFSEICEKHVHVTVVEGNHVTILNQSQLLEAVNKILTANN